MNPIIIAKIVLEIVELVLRGITKAQAIIELAKKYGINPADLKRRF